MTTFAPRLPQCDPANRDCSCADKSFKSCDPPAGNIEVHNDFTIFFTKFAHPIKMNCISTEILPILYIMIMFDNEWMYDSQSTLAPSPQMRIQENSANYCAHSKAAAPGEIFKIFAISIIGVHNPRQLQLVWYFNFSPFIHILNDLKPRRDLKVFED